MADVNGNGSIQILVTPLGGASPSGHSAVEIRRQLRTALSGQNGVRVNVLPKIDVPTFIKAIQTQLAAGVKINVTPNIVGATGSGTSGNTGATGTSKSDLTFLEKQLATLETKTASLTKRLQNLKNMPLRSKGMQEYQAQYDKIEQEIYELTAANRKLTETERVGIRSRVAELDKLVIHYEKLAAAQLKSADTIAAYKLKAQSAGGALLTDTSLVNSQQAIQVYRQLEQQMSQYAARGTALSKAETEWINQQIIELKRLSAESARYYKTQEANRQKSVLGIEKEKATLASMQMELAKFNQYLLTLNPKALSQFGPQIAQIRTLLGSGMASSSKEATIAMKQFKAAMVEAGYEGGNAMGVLFGKLKTYFSYFLSSTLIMAAYSGVTTLISNVKDLDEALTDLRIVTGNTRKETEELLESYNALAQKLGSTTVDVATGATDWLRQGFDAEDAEELLTQSMTLSIVGDMESADATDALTAAIKGYGLAVEDASGVVDKFMTVDMAAATSSEDLALALAKTAANAKIAGLSLDDVIGQLAVVNETMKESGEETGSFYNTMLSRMGAIKSGRLVDPETEESLSDVETTLNRLGIALRDEQGNFRNFGDVLNEVGQEWENYSTVNQRAIAQSFAGTRQQTRFLSLMEGWSQAAKYSSAASDSAGKSAQKLAIYQESVEAKTARATAAFEKFSTSLLSSGLVGGVMDLGAGLFNALSLLDGWPAKIALITASVAALSSAIKSLAAMNFGKNFIGFFARIGPAVAQLGAYGTALHLAKGFTLENTAALYQLGAAFAQMTPQQIAATASTRGLTYAQLEEVLVTSDLNQELIESALARYNLIAPTGAYTAATNAATVATGGLKATLTGLFATITAHPIGALITLFAAAATAVILFKKKHEQAIQESIEKAQELQDAYSNVVKELDSDVSTVTGLKDEFDKLSKGVSDNGNNISLSADEYDRYLEIVDQLVDINPALVKGFTAEGKAIVDKNAAIQDTIDLLKEQQRLELLEATSSENNWTIAEGLSNAYDKALKTAREKQSELGDTLRKAFIDSASYQVSDDGVIEDVLFNGRSRTEVYKELQKLFADFDYYETIVAGDQQVTDFQWNLLFNHIATASENTGAIIGDNIGYINSLLGTHVNSIADVSAALSQWTVANTRAEAAATTYQSQMKLIAQTATGYNDLSAGSKEFLNEWINTWKFTGKVTEQSVDSITQEIWMMVDTLSKIPELNSVMSVDYESLSGQMRQDFRNATARLLKDLVSQGKLTTTQAADIEIALGMTVIDQETGKPVEKYSDLYGQVVDKLRAAGYDFDPMDMLQLSITDLEYALTLDPAPWEDFLAAIKAGARDAAAAVSELTKVIEGLTTFEDAFNSLSDALDEFAENGYISADTVSELLEAFGDTDAMRDFLKTLGEENVTAEQVRTKLNALGNEYLETSGILDNLDESTLAWAGTLLESKGVINGAEVALQKLEQEKFKAELNSKNFISVNDTITNSFIAQAKAVGMTAETLQQLEKIKTLQTNKAAVLKSHEEAGSSPERIASISAYWDKIIADEQTKFNEMLADPAAFKLDFQWKTNVAENDTSDYHNTQFEKIYNEWKHKVEMEQATLEDFYAWLGSDEGYRAYFDPSKPKELEDYRKYAEEVFNGLRDLATDFSDEEHQIFLWEQEGGREHDIVTMYRQMQTDLHNVAQDIRKAMSDAGLEDYEIENSEIIQSLSKQWWEYEDDIKNVFDSINDTVSDYINDVKHEISLLEHTNGPDGANDALMMNKWAGLRTYLQGQIASYTATLKALNYTDEQIANTGVIQELQNALMECESSLQDVIDDMNDGLAESMETILDLTVEMIEKEKELEKEILQDQIDDYETIIKQRKEMLQLAERERSYREEVDDKTSEINRVQKQIDALSMDDSRAAAIERGKLEEELAELQKDLTDTQREHYISSVEDQLDTELDEFEKTQNKKIKEIEDFLDDQNALTQAAYDRLDNMNSSMFNDLLNYATKYTDTTREELISMWNDAKAAASSYGSYVEGLTAAQDGKFYNKAGAGTISGATSEAMKQTQIASIIQQMKTNSLNWHNLTPDKQQEMIKKNPNAGLAAILRSLTGRDLYLGNDGVWYYDKIGGEKVYTLHTGGVVGGDSMPTPKQDELFALLQKKEIVLNETQQSNLWNMLSSLGPIAALKKAFSSLTGQKIGSDSKAVSMSVDASVHIDGTMPDKQVMRILKNHPRDVANIVSRELDKL